MRGAYLALALACLVLVPHAAQCIATDDVAGPVVKAEEAGLVSGAVAVAVEEEPEALALGPVGGGAISDTDATEDGAPPPPPPSEESKVSNNTFSNLVEAVHEKAKEVAKELDTRLIAEFGNGSSTDGAKVGEAFAAALNGGSGADGGEGEDEGETHTLETVVRISSRDDEDRGGKGHNADGDGDDGEGGSGNSQPEDDGMGAIEKSVDRIIDQHGSEFVLSNPKDEIPVLTVDAQLIQDLSVLFIAAASLGTLFHMIGQPCINGYLIAGAVVGPGGLSWVKELVQVESVAQLGVFLLLFALGLELNLSKLRSVMGASVIGGSVQIGVCMVLGGAVSAWLYDAPVTPGVFTGALLAMSSTSVVIKCLEATHSMSSPYGTITVGTLILQDCWVGIIFALMPMFKPSPTSYAAAAGSVLHPGTLEAAASASSGSGGAERTAVVLVAILKTLFKIFVIGGASLWLSRVLLSRPLRAMARHATTEVTQMVLLGLCLASTALGGHTGISEELGAFLGGLMVSAAASGAASLPGPPPRLKCDSATNHAHNLAGGAGTGGGGAEASPKPLHAVGSGGASVRNTHSVADLAPSASVSDGTHQPLLSASSPTPGGGGGGGAKAGAAGGAANGGGGGGGVAGLSPAGLAKERARVAEELQHALRRSIDSLHNALVALFLSSMALIISPRFLLSHLSVLATGTALTMLFKTILVAGTVSYFGHPWRTSLAVGLTMAHVGEFSFVLLSTSAHLDILPAQVYQLLLGITALSLLATPLVIIMCSRLLREAAVVQPCGGGGGGGGGAAGGGNDGHVAIKMVGSGGDKAEGNGSRKPFRLS